MSTPITGSAATGLILGTATVPAAGDYVTGGGLQVTAQAVENDIVNLLEWVVPNGNRLVTKWIELEPFYDTPAATWTFGSAVNVWGDGGREGSALYYPLPVPHRALLFAVNVRILPAGGHGVLPAVLPKVEVLKSIVSTNTSSVAATASDAPASVAAYEAAHTFGLTMSGSNTAWASSTAYTVGTFRKNGGNLYMCTHAGTSDSSGGPSGTSQLILDGTVVWTYAHGDASYPIDRSLNRYQIRVTGEDDAVDGVVGLQVIGVQVGYYLLTEQGQ